MSKGLKDNTDRLVIPMARLLKRRLTRLASLAAYSPPPTRYAREVLERHFDKEEKRLKLEPLRE